MMHGSTGGDQFIGMCSLRAYDDEDLPMRYQHAAVVPGSCVTRHQTAREDVGESSRE